MWYITRLLIITQLTLQLCSCLRLRSVGHSIAPQSWRDVTTSKELIFRFQLRTAAVSSFSTEENERVESLRVKGTSSFKRAARGDLVFSRTNRVRGMQRWENEIRNFIETATDQRLRYFSLDGSFSQTPCSEAIAARQRYEEFYQSRVELLSQVSKELLYSGIPEQVIELFTAYQDALPVLHPQSLIDVDLSNMGNRNVSNTNDGIVSKQRMQYTPDIKLVMIAARAFVALSDLRGASSLLRSCTRLGVDLNSDQKVQLMSDLAEHSAEGLQSALQLRLSMLERGEAIGISGAVGILRGVWMHGMMDINALVEGADFRDEELLVDSVMQAEVIAKERSAKFRLSARAAETLAHQIARQYIIPPQNMQPRSTRSSGNRTTLRAGKSKRSHGLVRELLRIFFRAAALQHRVPRWKGSSVDPYSEKVREREVRTIAGLRGAVAAMASFGIEWNQHVADVLIDECFRLKDITGVQCVVHQMTTKVIFASTTTFNSLLRRYAESGDAESAYLLLNKVMSSSSTTAPNSESYELLLRACLITRRGRYLGKLVMSELLDESNNKTEAVVNIPKTKAIWDLLLELTIKTDGNYLSTLILMIADNVQPDCQTMATLYNALGQRGNIESVIHLYKLQQSSEECRTLAIPRPGIDISETIAGFSIMERRISSLLPSPTAFSVRALLLMLRDEQQHEFARQVLDDVLDRADKLNATLYSSTYLSKTTSSSGSQIGDVVTLIPASTSGRELLVKHYEPNCELFSIVMEASLFSNTKNQFSEFNNKATDGTVCDEDSGLSSLEKLEIVLELLTKLEKYGLSPDRRIYSNLITAFGQNNDALSALGVFQEMRQKFYPDVASLQSILDACMNNPTDLRQACSVLEEMAAQDHVDLDVYTNDLLMQSFDDARALGACLEKMEAQEVSEDCDCVEVSLQVLGVLVQAVRTTEGIAGIESALYFLGAAGIRADSETMEYFRIHPDPLLHSPNSRHYHRSLLPQQRKRPSVLDSEMPIELAPDLSLPIHRFRSLLNKRRSSQDPECRSTGYDSEPYFESGYDEWGEHSSLLQQLMINKGEDTDTYEMDIDVDFFRQARPSMYSEKGPALFNEGNAPPASRETKHIESNTTASMSYYDMGSYGYQRFRSQIPQLQSQHPLSAAQRLLRNLKENGPGHTIIVGSLDEGAFINPAMKNREKLLKECKEELDQRIDSSGNGVVDDEFGGEEVELPVAGQYILLNDKIESYDEDKHYVPSVSDDLLSSVSIPELRSILQLTSDNSAISKDMHKMKARIRSKESKENKRIKGKRGKGKSAASK